MLGTENTFGNMQNKCLICGNDANYPLHDPQNIDNGHTYQPTYIFGVDDIPPMQMGYGAPNGSNEMGIK